MRKTASPVLIGGANRLDPNTEKEVWRTDQEALREGARDHAFNTTRRKDKSTTPASSADRREGRLDDLFQKRDLGKLKPAQTGYR